MLGAQMTAINVQWHQLTCSIPFLQWPPAPCLSNRKEGTLRCSSCQGRAGRRGVVKKAFQVGHCGLHTGQIQGWGWGMERSGHLHEAEEEGDGSEDPQESPRPTW